MSQDTKSLIFLTLGCTVAAALFGFGANVFSFRSAYEDLGREQLLQLTRLLVYLAVAVILAFKGGWRGVAAAVFMAFAATVIEWALFPFSYTWASLSDPTGYAEEFGEVGQPSYMRWLFDVVGVSLAAAFTQGLRVILLFAPRASEDE